MAALADVLGAFRAKQYERAANLALAARAHGQTHPVLHDVVAFHLRRQGDYDGALAEFERALALDPGSTTLMLNLAACQLKIGLAQAARDGFQKVLELKPDHPEALYGLGSALDRLEDGQGALAAYMRAVAVAPNHGPALGALANLAIYDRELGRAQALAERALAASPGQLDAEVALARLDAGERRHASLKQRAQALLERADLPPEIRASALILLGDALDGEGDAASAFAAYAEGKAMQHRQHASGYEAAGMCAITERAIDAFAHQPAGWRFRPYATPASDAPRAHAFLMGFARSGTTLLEQVLGGHPEVVTLEEAPTLEDAQARFVEPKDGFVHLAMLEEPQRAQLARGYWRRVRALGVEPAGKVFIDKAPFATLKIPVIAALFPEVRILFALRDPRDVVLSCFRRDFRINPSTFELTNLERAARFYDVTMRAGLTFRERCALEVHEIRYEQFVADFEGECRAACGFLGLDWREELRDFASRRRDRPIRTPSAPQVARGLYTDGVGQWRRYREQLSPVLPILAPWVERFGYPHD